MTHTLVGTNWFALKAELDRLVSDFVSEHGDLAIERLDMQERTSDELGSALEAQPFLSAKKMVIAENISANKEAYEKLEALLNKADDTTDFIIVESKVDKRSVYYKQLKKLKNFQEFSEPDHNSLTSWTQETVKSRGGAISSGDARYLVERIGLDQTRLASELEKLVQYNPHINRVTIDLLTEETPTSTIFNLIDSAFSGNTKRALGIYEEQRAQKVEPQAVMAMLIWQMHIVSLVAHAPKEKTTDQIAKDAGLNPYVVQKSQGIAQKMGVTKIRSTMKLLRDIDLSSKTKTINYDDSLKYLIVSLSA